MEKDDWLAMNISLALLILGNIVVLFLPETLAEKTAIDVDEDVEPPKKLQILMKHVKNYIASLKGVWTFIVANKKLMLLFISISFCVLGKFMSAFLGQYITARYHWKWSKVSLRWMEALRIHGAEPLLRLPTF